MSATVLAGNQEITLHSDTLRHLAVACNKTDDMQRADDAETDLVNTQKELDDEKSKAQAEELGHDSRVQAVAGQTG
jgi:hypothetical protein